MSWLRVGGSLPNFHGHQSNSNSSRAIVRVIVKLSRIDRNSDIKLVATVIVVVSPNLKPLRPKLGPCTPY